MPKYKLIATDMDGTLLTSDKRITLRAMAAIDSARRQGVAFTIASGRPYVSAKRFIDRLSLNIPAILYNGCRLVMPDGKVLHDKLLDPGDVRTLWRLTRENGVASILWSDEELFTPGMNERVLNYSKASGLNAQVIGDIEPVISRGVTKILWMDTSPRIAALREMAHSQGLESVTMCTSDPSYLEFFSSAASKGIALGRLAEHLGIAPDEIIALGDEENDIPMLQYAGMGVAMGSAGEKVRAAANMVTENSDNEGFAKAIESLLA